MLEKRSCRPCSRPRPHHASLSKSRCLISGLPARACAIPVTIFPMEIIATTMDRQFREIFQKMQRGIYASEPYEYLMVDSVSNGREAMVSMMVRTIVFS